MIWLVQCDVPILGLSVILSVASATATATRSVATTTTAAAIATATGSVIKLLIGGRVVVRALLGWACTRNQSAVAAECKPEINYKRRQVMKYNTHVCRKKKGKKE